MPTTNKSFEQPTAGSTNWDVPLNANFGYIDTALGGTTSKSVTGVGTTPVVLTADEYRRLGLSFTGTLTANVTYNIPAGVGGQWIVSNDTTGAFTVSIGMTGYGFSVTIPQGSKRTIYSNGGGIDFAETSLGNGTVTSVAVSGGTTGLTTSGGPITGSGTITLAGTLAVANGGTGATSAATARTNLGLGSMATQASTAVSITGGTVAAAAITGALNAAGTAPIYACRAWVNFNGQGTVAIRGSGNVTSITDNGTGDYTVNFTTAMQDANYAAVVGGNNNQTNNGYIVVNVITASDVRVLSRNDQSGFSDGSIINVAIFR